MIAIVDVMDGQSGASIVISACEGKNLGEICQKVELTVIEHFRGIGCHLTEERNAYCVDRNTKEILGYRYRIILDEKMGACWMVTVNKAESLENTVELVETATMPAIILLNYHESVVA